MNIKKLSLAVAGALLVVGCAGNQGIVKNADLKPDTDSIRPKPVSTVFHRPQGTMTITFDSKGEFLEITSKGTAPIAGNNAFSIEQAAQVAQLRAKRNIAEFISTQLQTTRSVKVLSTAVQKSLEKSEKEIEIIFFLFVCNLFLKRINKFHMKKKKTDTLVFSFFIGLCFLIKFIITK